MQLSDGYTLVSTTDMMEHIRKTFGHLPLQFLPHPELLSGEFAIRQDSGNVYGNGQDIAMLQQALSQRMQAKEQGRTEEVYGAVRIPPSGPLPEGYEIMSDWSQIPRYVSVVMTADEISTKWCAIKKGSSVVYVHSDDYKTMLPFIEVRLYEPLASIRAPI